MGKVGNAQKQETGAGAAEHKTLHPAGTLPRASGGEIEGEGEGEGENGLAQRTRRRRTNCTATDIGARTCQGRGVASGPLYMYCNK